MKKRVFLLLKILLGIACFFFIWIKLKTQFTEEKTNLFFETLTSKTNLSLFLTVVFMLFPNWLIESYKWQLISSVIEKISFKSAVKGVFSGICIGNLTPGRMGEFAGKLFYFKPENRSKITVTHFVCGSTQLFITVVFGIISLLFFINTKSSNQHFIVLSLSFALLALLLLTLILIRMDYIYLWLSKLKWLKKFELGSVVYPKSMLIKLLLYSIIRYFVFSSQYIFLLQICGAKANYLELLMPVSISFMLTSTIPMISFIEVAIRAGIALVLFADYLSNDLLIVTASSALWLINIIIPSVIGYFIILGTKLKTK